MSQYGFIHVDVERIMAETESAFLVIIEGQQYWLPKSQVADADDSESGDKEITLSITEWIAEQKGLESE